MVRTYIHNLRPVYHGSRQRLWNKAAILIKIIDEAFIFETKGDNVIG